MTRSLSQAAHLERAADYIDAHGHYRGAICPQNPRLAGRSLVAYLRETTPPVCAAGALWATVEDDADVFLRVMSAADRAHETLIKVLDQPVVALAVWNDLPGREAVEVTGLFRLTAQRLRTSAPVTEAPAAELLPV